jgi:hypothetical protein
MAGPVGRGVVNKARNGLALPGKAGRGNAMHGTANEAQMQNVQVVCRCGAVFTTASDRSAGECFGCGRPVTKETQVSRFNFIAYDELSAAQSGRIRDAMQSVEAQLLLLPEGRPRSLALTKLEEAFMWSGKAVRDAQLEREGAS